jgi:hypothetical protein
VPDDDYLILSTVHSAKGGSWRVVPVIQAADGMFPSDLATGDIEGVEEAGPEGTMRPTAMPSGAGLCPRRSMISSTTGPSGRSSPTPPSPRRR